MPFLAARQSRPISKQRSKLKPPVAPVEHNEDSVNCVEKLEMRPEESRGKARRRTSTVPTRGTARCAVLQAAERGSGDLDEFVALAQFCPVFEVAPLSEEAGQTLTNTNHENR